MNKLKYLLFLVFFFYACSTNEAPTKKDIEFEGSWISTGVDSESEPIPFHVFASGKKFRVVTVSPYVKIGGTRPKIMIVSDGNRMFIKQPTIIQDNGMIGYVDGESFIRFLPGSEKYETTIASWDGSYKVIEKPLPSSSDSFPWVGGEIWWNNYYSDGYNKYITIEKGKGEMVAGRETIRYETSFIGTYVDFVDKEHKILLTRIAPSSSQSLECKEIKFSPVSKTYFSKP